MPALNIVHLIGNLTRNPELRVTSAGTSICQFGIAINRKFKDGTGAEREEVLFLDCEAWGKAGDVIAQYVTKGRPLYVGGRLKLDQWEDKTTHEKKSKIKVVVENFQFLGNLHDAAQKPAAQEYDSNPPSRPGGAPEKPAQERFDDDGDVPF